MAATREKGIPWHASARSSQEQARRLRFPSDSSEHVETAAQQGQPCPDLTRPDASLQKTTSYPDTVCDAQTGVLLRKDIKDSRTALPILAPAHRSFASTLGGWPLSPPRRIVSGVRPSHHQFGIQFGQRPASCGAGLCQRRIAAADWLLHRPKVPLVCWARESSKRMEREGFNDQLPTAERGPDLRQLLCVPSRGANAR